MLFAGCDVGSLTAEAVLLDDGGIVGAAIMNVRATPTESASAVMEQALCAANRTAAHITSCYSTGYGRFSIPFAAKNVSEISCHGLGAHWVNPHVRGVIDIGGQDCKVIRVDPRGRITDFVMNDKCAAGTGRSLEILSAAIGVSLSDLGPLSLRSSKPVRITNKCSLFMELEVLGALVAKKRIRDIAAGINDAVAGRVASLARSVALPKECAITGGVSKNAGVVRRLEERLDLRFVPLSVDPQLIGALGAALFARREYPGGET